MKTTMLLLATPVALALGLLASAQSTASLTPNRDQMIAPVIVPEEPFVQLPSLPVGPTGTVVPSSWHKLPNLALAPGKVPVNQGLAQNFCTSTINSSGFAAWMDCVGSLSVCQNDTCLAVEGVPQYSSGLFFYGDTAAQVPVANGYLCISPFHTGLFRLPPVTANVNMHAELNLDFKTLPAVGAITPGSSWCFQYWFRDPAAGGAGSNFSDALQITFCN